MKDCLGLRKVHQIFRKSEVTPIYPPPVAERRARPARGEPRARARSARERAPRGRTQGGMPEARPPPPRHHRRKHRRRVINNGGAQGASPTGEARTHAGGLSPNPPATLCRRLQDTGRDGGNQKRSLTGEPRRATKTRRARAEPDGQGSQQRRGQGERDERKRGRERAPVAAAPFDPAGDNKGRHP